MRVRSLASTAALAVVAAGFTAFQQPAMAATGTTLYVDRGAATCIDSGSGTQAAPFCTIQTAANAAVAGDTVLISGDDWGYANYDENVVISKSGTVSAPITFKAAQESFRLFGKNAGLHIDHASHVNVIGASSWSSTGPAITIASSSNITIDGSSAEPSSGVAVQVSGASDHVTIERSRAAGIEVDGPASNTTVTTNLVSGSGVVVSGATGTDVTGNTISSICATAVSVANASQTIIENNVLAPNCSGPGTTLTVDAASANATTVGYNIVSTNGGNAVPYTWAGTSYSTVAVFQAATSQGTADIVEPTVDVSTNSISSGNPAIDSANSNAPGELPVDVNGNPRADDPSVSDTGVGAYTYYDRGAIEYREYTAATFMYDADSAQRVTATLDLQGFAWGSNATYDVAWGDGSTYSTNASGIDQIVERGLPANHMYAQRGTYTVTATLTDDAQTITRTLTVSTHGSNYTAVAPTRVLDTRRGIGAPKAKVPANGSVPVDVTSGVTGAPAAGTITAVVLNVTATDPAAGGYITAYPDGGSRPKSSNLNFSAGQTVPNLVTVKVKNGKVDLFNGSGGTADLIADVEGYYVDANAPAYTSVVPARLLDTRKGTGAPARAVAPGGTVTLKVAGVGSIPASGVSAVALNVTVTAPTGGGYITVYPDQTTMPTASNLNYSPGETVPNMVVVKAGANGDVDLHNTSSGTVQLIADVAGYYSASGGDAFVPADPTRLLDTRNATGQEAAAGIPAPPDSDVRWATDELVGDAGIVLNVTVTNPQAGGYVTAYPGSAPRPTVSNLNFSPGETVPNLVMVDAANGDVRLYNGSGGTTDLIADMFGYFS